MSKSTTRRLFNSAELNAFVSAEQVYEAINLHFPGLMASLQPTERFWLREDLEEMTMQELVAVGNALTAIVDKKSSKAKAIANLMGAQRRRMIAQYEAAAAKLGVKADREPAGEDATPRPVEGDEKVHASQKAAKKASQKGPKAAKEPKAKAEKAPKAEKTSKPKSEKATIRVKVRKGSLYLTNRTDVKISIKIADSSNGTAYNDEYLGAYVEADAKLNELEAAGYPISASGRKIINAGLL
jgi:chemotaxis protein histidine kinase CheA